MRLVTNEFAPLSSVKIHDGFWSRYQDIAKDKIIPYQWRVLNDQVPNTEPSHAIANFRIAAGLEEANSTATSFRTATSRSGLRPWPTASRSRRTKSWSGRRTG